MGEEFLYLQKDSSKRDISDHVCIYGRTLDNNFVSLICGLSDETDKTIMGLFPKIMRDEIKSALEGMQNSPVFVTNPIYIGSRELIELYNFPGDKLRLKGEYSNEETEEALLLGWFWTADRFFSKMELPYRSIISPSEALKDVNILDYNGNPFKFNYSNQNRSKMLIDFLKERSNGENPTISMNHALTILDPAESDLKLARENLVSLINNNLLTVDTKIRIGLNKSD